MMRADNAAQRAYAVALQTLTIRQINSRVLRRVGDVHGTSLVRTGISLACSYAEEMARSEGAPATVWVRTDSRTVRKAFAETLAMIDEFAGMIRDHWVATGHLPEGSN